MSWDNKATCDKCGKVITYDEYIEHSGYCTLCENGNLLKGE